MVMWARIPQYVSNVTANQKACSADRFVCSLKRFPKMHLRHKQLTSECAW